jgi:hypothetical protein
MEVGPVITATAPGSALMTVLRALMTNYPITLPPRMGMNAFFAYAVRTRPKVIHYLEAGKVTGTEFIWPPLIDRMGVALENGCLAMSRRAVTTPRLHCSIEAGSTVQQSLSS